MNIRDGVKYELVNKEYDGIMTFVGKVASWFGRDDFMTDYWTTYRRPWENFIRICVPLGESQPLKQEHIIEHELIHAKDMSTAWGLLKTLLLVTLFPLPVLFSGRWFVERRAYLHNIKNHGYDIDRVVDALWSGYMWPWPKAWMKKWFEKQMK